MGSFKTSWAQVNPDKKKTDSRMMLRIAEIEIFPQYLEEYLVILKAEAAASVELEPGVLAIFPMYQNDYPNQIRIVEMYANKDAYLSHLKTPHFLHYKTSTQKMVKSLKLVDMKSIDPEGMKKIFRKIEQE
ncbi:putative quinol monooxygenase [Pedobacter sp. SAFR-022]|uniref:putative quinol monooxygenase n=1 Tax=Pedobacter sp. SAFR-022 TaxID=3436861 RepID=UPI003F81FCD0